MSAIVHRFSAFVRKLTQPEFDEAAGPDFRDAGQPNASEIVRLRLRRPIVAGSIVVLVLVFGLLVWATFFSIAGAVVAVGTVRVEGNVKQIKHREGGVIRQILVHEGDRVKRGQILMRFDPVQAQASVDIYQADYDAALADIARFQAEATNARDIRFPVELLNRQSDPRVSALIASQRSLFTTRMALYRSQAVIYQGQARQLATQIEGMRAQAVSGEAQSALIDDELQGVRDLNRLGYAPRSRLLALQRNAAALKGQRGGLVSDIGRTNQAIGDIRLQISQLEDKRQTEIAQGLQVAQGKLTEVAPKLRAMQESLAQIEVRSPVDGYIFNLTQFTEGGVAQPGEPLMQIVPAGMPLQITAQVRPNDIAEVRLGMPARITLTAYNPRTTPEVDGRVVLVAADASTDEATHTSYYVVRIKVYPSELAKAGPNVHLTPGMPATVAIVTGKRTIMDYLLGPMTEAMRTAMRER